MAMTMEMEEEMAASDGFQKAFDELEAQKTIIDNCTRVWKSLSDHYASLERSLAKRTEALESKVRDLDSKAAQSLEALSERESAIPDRESAAVALIEQRRDAAISEMESPPSEPSAGISFDLPGALRGYCRRMDSVGLWQFMVARRKDLGLLRREISDAVAESVDPARLVLDAVEDFVEHQDEGAGIADRCWACAMLLRTIFDGDGTKDPEIPRSIKEKAEAVAKSWKKKVEERMEGVPTGGAEAQMFLQLIGAFGVQAAIEEDFVKKLIIDFASRKEIPKLAARLRLGEKLIDIIDELVKTGKEIEAVCIAHEAGLTDDFSPISLLKSYLQNSRRNANTILKNGNHSLSATEESSNLELNALRSIIKCVESLKLEQEFALESPRKRVQMLEKAKAERKKVAAVKPYNKRPRIAGQSTFFRPTKTTRTPTSPYPSSRRQLPPMDQYIPRRPATHS
ncbi:unnamed protein product [Spirodela intermedia]|uniref:FRIGIDA-like protein n=1 Tax=Spirodela intermedia TaxID=51605 RepID=A0A7I8J843_SPIIN|nr:unnamed protein product [Spirodela intermedia]CAA6666259.1 unnamed protein product [Spirodela intermedia]